MTFKKQKNIYARLYKDFNWNISKSFNIANFCCKRWAKYSSKIAIINDDSSKKKKYTYEDLNNYSNQLSNALLKLNIKKGSIVGIIMQQKPEVAISHFACYKIGAIAMPLAHLFSLDSLKFRLKDSEAEIIICDENSFENVKTVFGDCPKLLNVISINYPSNSNKNFFDFYSLISKENLFLKEIKTQSIDPALLIYTSGTTGNPKGTLLSHSTLIGNLPGFVASQNWFPQKNDIFWSPADWAWTGGLMDALLPTLYFGHPIVSCSEKFSSSDAFRIMEKYSVTNTFLFPTALKKMLKDFPEPLKFFNLKLRAIMSAGEPLGNTVFDWAKNKLNITINEMYGQTEANYLIGNSSKLWPVKPGSIGKPYPGHEIILINSSGVKVPIGKIGQIAVKNSFKRKQNPIIFKNYWKNKKATKEKFFSDWLLTGDMAKKDKDGYYWYQGRKDDMFKSSGYRIGPSEIENCLIKHENIENAAIIPKPDENKGNIIKAYIVLTKKTPNDIKSKKKIFISIQNHIKKYLSRYQQPKEIEFIDSLPMTTSGKIRRVVLKNNYLKK